MPSTLGITVAAYLTGIMVALFIIIVIGLINQKARNKKD